jgi:hypothetical protein
MTNDEVFPHARALSEEPARNLIDTLDRRAPGPRCGSIRSSQIATAVLGSVGAPLLFVENAAQDIPFVSNAWGSNLVGLVLLAATGTLLARLGSSGG